MIMYEAMKQHLQESNPDFAERLNVKNIDYEQWHMLDRIPINTLSDKYDLTGNHYIVADGPNAGIHTLWSEPTAEMDKWMRATKRVHAKDKRYVIGVCAVHTPGTGAFLMMDTILYVAQNWIRSSPFSMVSMSDKGLSETRMQNAPRFCKLMLQLRLICAEASKIGYPIERKDNVNFLPSSFLAGGTALDMII